MTDIRFEDMNRISGGEGPQYTGGGLTEKAKEIMKETRETFEKQKAYFPKSYNGLYDNDEGWDFDPALCKDQKGPTIGK